MWNLRGFTNENGQTTVIAAVGLTVILAFLGLGIDVGQLRYAKRNLQMAADAAALAATLEIEPCAGTPNCTAMQTAAQNALVENGLTGATLVTNCATTATTGLTLMVNNPACSLGANDPNAGKNNFVEVSVSQPQTTYFAKLLGFANVPLVARAQAMRSGAADCMYALDPNGGNAITVDLLAAVSSPCGIVDESTASNALSCNLLAAVNVPEVKVAGGVENFLCSMSSGVTTKATMPHPADPLAYLPKPAVPDCGTSTASPYHGASSTVNILGNATLYADAAYCGGIIVGPLANVTFEPGTYVLGSSHGIGGLAVNLGSTVSGSDVMFYNYGPSGGINFLLTLPLLGNIDLRAPTSGTYGGMLFFQDPGNTTPAYIAGGVNLGGILTGTRLQGTYYFPTAKVTYALSGLQDYNTLVAYDIDFAVLTLGFTKQTTGFTNNYSSLANGSPAGGSGAVLVQ